MKRNVLLWIFLLICISGCSNNCSKKQIQSEPSPDGKHIIKTYLVNCHATVDWKVEAELCNGNNECKEIYDCYHEKDSLVYWIDNETVFINNKTLNIYKDKYDWRNDKDYENSIYKVK